MIFNKDKHAGPQKIPLKLVPVREIDWRNEPIELDSFGMDSLTPVSSEDEECESGFDNGFAGIRHGQKKIKGDALGGLIHPHKSKKMDNMGGHGHGLGHGHQGSEMMIEKKSLLGFGAQNSSLENNERGHNSGHLRFNDRPAEMKSKKYSQNNALLGLLKQNSNHNNERETFMHTAEGYGREKYQSHNVPHQNDLFYMDDIQGQGQGEQIYGGHQQGIRPKEDPSKMNVGRLSNVSNLLAGPGKIGQPQNQKERVNRQTQLQQQQQMLQHQAHGNLVQTATVQQRGGNKNALLETLGAPAEDFVHHGREPVQRQMAQQPPSLQSLSNLYQDQNLMMNQNQNQQKPHGSNFTQNKPMGRPQSQLNPHQGGSALSNLVSKVQGNPTNGYYEIEEVDSVDMAETLEMNSRNLIYNPNSGQMVHANHGNHGGHSMGGQGSQNQHKKMLQNHQKISHHAQGQDKMGHTGNKNLNAVMGGDRNRDSMGHEKRGIAQQSKNIKKEGKNPNMPYDPFTLGGNDPHHGDSTHEALENQQTQLMGQQGQVNIFRRLKL